MSFPKDPYGTPYERPNRPVGCICPSFGTDYDCPYHGPQLAESTRRDLAHFHQRRRRFFVGLAWVLLATLIFALWFAGVIHAQTQITPRQIRGLASLVVMQCAGVTAAGPPASDCTGLYYVDLVRADGTELKILGAPPAAGVTIDPTHWSVIP